MFQASLINRCQTLRAGSFGVLMLFRDRLTGEGRAMKFVLLGWAPSLADWEREEVAWRTAAASANPGSHDLVRGVSGWVGVRASKRAGPFIREALDLTVLDDIRKRAPVAPPRLAVLTWASQQLMQRLLALVQHLQLSRGLTPNNELLQGLDDVAVLMIGDMGSFHRLARLMMSAALQHRPQDIWRGLEAIMARPAQLPVRLLTSADSPMVMFPVDSSM